VQGQLTRVFRQYGLPETILCDNGGPWGSVTSGGVTALTVWLLRLGVDVGHGRPYHPQTQGKEERFHLFWAIAFDARSRRTCWWGGSGPTMRHVRWRLMPGDTGTTPNDRMRR